MPLSIIVAVAENNVIGKDNDLIWRLPVDLKYFKKTTLGHPVIMGRKTFESFPGLLPGRKNIIITRQKKYEVEGATVVSSIEKAIEICDKNDEIFIAGGAEIYRQTLDMVSKIYLTHVHETFKGDAFFLPLNLEVWKQTQAILVPKDDKNPHDCTFMVFEKS
ncbi:MAG: dihydrofolate reductase [Sphingobacteriales bacterium]|jgi:dihydrofolate reductase